MLHRDVLKTRTQTSPGQFVATSWTAVATAGQGDSPEAQEALASLCQAYWQPLHAYVRRLGHNPEDAKDLTQQFFFVLISKNYLGAADRTKGKFRTFLLTALRHFLANEWDKSRAKKRGSGKPLISLDDTGEDGDSIPFEPSTDISPLKLYEQGWARTVFKKAVQVLSQEQAEANKAETFDALKGFLEETTPPGGYESVAEKLQMPVGTIRVTVHRLRHRLAEIVRAEVAATLVNPSEEEVEEEVQHLFEAFE